MRNFVLRTVLGVHLLRKSIGLGLFPLAFLFSPAIPAVHSMLSSLARIDPVLALVVLIGGSAAATYLVGNVIAGAVFISRFPSGVTALKPFLAEVKEAEKRIVKIFGSSIYVSAIAYMASFVLFLELRTPFGFLVLMPAALAFENHSVIRKVLGKY